MPTIDKEHAALVQELAKPGEAVIETLTPSTANLLHMVVGVCGEAGELLDAVKKHAIYGKAIDLENVIEELGDLEFYMSGIRQELDVKRSQTLQANIDKLRKRYPKGYNDKDAQARADKAPIEVKTILDGTPVHEQPPCDCPSCGMSCEETNLKPCPHCEETKCPSCDMGDDVGCINCD